MDGKNKSPNFLNLSALSVLCGESIFLYRVSVVRVHHEELRLGRGLFHESLAFPPEADSHEQGNAEPEEGDFVLEDEEIDGLCAVHRSEVIG